MRVIGSASEEEMILAFVRAEWYSPRFGSVVRRALSNDAGVIYHPRLDDDQQNAARRAALAAVRGYGNNTYLFRDFPMDAQWSRVVLRREDVGDLLYADYPTWVALSGGTRRVGDGAANIETLEVEDVNVNIRSVTKAMRDGRTFAEIILAAETPDAPFVVVEGHTRATAHFLTMDDHSEIEAIVGFSPAMTGWAFY